MFFSFFASGVCFVVGERMRHAFAGVREPSSIFFVWIVPVYRRRQAGSRAGIGRCVREVVKFASRSIDNHGRGTT